MIALTRLVCGGDVELADPDKGLNSRRGRAGVRIAVGPV